VTEPVWVTLEDVLGLHAMQLTTFGGPPGIRDRNGVESALSRPQQHWHYAAVSDLFQLAAIYVESFATTQHFVDGNKRVALHSALLFLRLNGYRLEADRYLPAQAVLDVANKVMTAEQMGVWFAAHAKVFDASVRDRAFPV
jgi:death on curing protein